MAGATGGAGSSNPSPAPAPKILLAKPGLVTTGSVSSKLIRGGAACGGGGGGGGAEDESVSLRSRLPPIGSLNLLSDSWEFHTDRFLPVIFSVYILFCFCCFGLFGCWENRGKRNLKLGILNFYCTKFQFFWIMLEKSFCLL